MSGFFWLNCKSNVLIPLLTLGCGGNYLIIPSGGLCRGSGSIFGELGTNVWAGVGLCCRFWV